MPPYMEDIMNFDDAEDFDEDYEDVDEDEDVLLDIRRAILGLIVVAYVPLSATAIAGMLGIEDVDDVKTCLRSFSTEKVHRRMNIYTAVYIFD